MLTVGQTTILSMTSFEYNSISFILLKTASEIVFDGLKVSAIVRGKEVASFGGRTEARTVANGNVKVQRVVQERMN